MKLLMCRHCGDVFNLDYQYKYCKCKAVKGRYLNDLDAEYSGDYAIPLGFANNSISVAIKNQPMSGMGYNFNAFVIPAICDTFIKR